MSLASSLSQIGALRIALLAFVIFCMPMVYFADMEPVGIGVLTAYVIPAVVVIFVFVLALDALMNRIFMIEQPEEVVAVKRVQMWLNLLAIAGLAFFWWPYYESLATI